MQSIIKSKGCVGICMCHIVYCTFPSLYVPIFQHHHQWVIKKKKGKLQIQDVSTIYSSFKLLIFVKDKFKYKQVL